jgi:hypothetical protein
MRCKPGDLAIVIGVMTEKCAPRLGTMCEVLSFHPAGTEVFNMPGFVFSIACWRVKFSDGKYGAWADQNLLPIRPEGEPADVDQKLEVPA